MDYLLRLFIPTLYALLWIPFPIHYMGSTTQLVYIHIYGYTTKRNTAVINEDV